jgi:mRNA interferase MazF
VVKPVAGEVVVIPFPRSDDSASGKRRPALVIDDLPGQDLILCQIASRAHFDAFAVPMDGTDFEHGQFAHQCFIRPQRLFTVDCRVILKSVGRANAAKFDDLLVKVRELFN